MINFLRFLFLITASTFFTICQAENIWNTGYRKILVEDTARSEVVYVHIAQDRILDKQEVKYEMLSLGDKITVYDGYGDYQLDSIFSTFNRPLKYDEAMRLIREYEPINESMTINRAENVLNFYGGIFINYYRYSEPIPKIEWILTDETEEILGYECHKATAKWRGRDWTAWYSDIPVDAGPWKFQGLPGLILKVEDSTGDHSIYAISIEKIVYPIGHTYKGWNKTTREKYNEGKKDYALHSGEIIANSGMVTFQSEEEKKRLSNRRRFHAPLELE